MKISILLPYKENYTSNNAGAVSLFVNDMNRESAFKKTTQIFGNTSSENKLSKNYINLDLNKKIFQSTSKQYVQTFLNYQKEINSDLIEIHNRPNYLKDLTNKLVNRSYVIYFHNDPLTMKGSKTVSERKEI